MNPNVVRRIAALVAAGAITLAACGDDSESSATSPSETPASSVLSSVTSAAPSSDVTTADGDPTSVGRVVALDEFAGLAALSLGVVPAEVQLVFGYSTAKAIFDAADVPTTRAPADGVNLEAVAASQPSAILGVSIPTTAAVEAELGAIAPTTVISYTASWQDQLTQVGDAVGRVDEAAALIERIEAEIDALATDLAAEGLGGTSVSVVGALGTDMFALSATGNVGSLLAAVGLERPAAQAVETDPTNPFLPLSAETLTEHDADRIVLMSGGSYEPSALTGSPLWSTLGAVADGRLIEVSAEMWFSSSAFATSWILSDLRAALLGEGSVAADADAAARWAEFAGSSVG